MLDWLTVDLIAWIVLSLTLFKLFLDAFKRIIALAKAKCACYCVKTVFAFNRGDEHKVGVLVYYSLSKVDECIKDKKENKGLVGKAIYDEVFSTVESIPIAQVFGTNPPRRIVIKEEFLKKYTRVMVASDSSIVVLNKVGTDPEVYWTGTCAIFNNKDLARIVTKKLVKEYKHDTTCHVVRS